GAPGCAGRGGGREGGAYGPARPAKHDTPRGPAGRRPAKKALRSRTRELVRADLAKPASKSWRRRLSSAGVMSVVFGMFAAFGIPAAFAEQNRLAEDAGPLAGQKVEILASVADEAVGDRDAYGTTSAADLRRVYA